MRFSDSVVTCWQGFIVHTCRTTSCSRKNASQRFLSGENTKFKTSAWCEQGSMLWSQFSAIFANFRRKNWRFLKNQCYDQNFAKFSFILSQKRLFFRWIFRRKYFKNHNIGPRYLLAIQLLHLKTCPGDPNRGQCCNYFRPFIVYVCRVIHWRDSISRPWNSNLSKRRRYLWNSPPRQFGQNYNIDPCWIFCWCQLASIF
jgi:hypothetical protein